MRTHLQEGIYSTAMFYSLCGNISKFGIFNLNCFSAQLCPGLTEEKCSLVIPDSSRKKFLRLFRAGMEKTVLLQRKRQFFYRGFAHVEHCALCSGPL